MSFFTYFFRHPRPEYHSIERLFTQLANQLNHQVGHKWISQVRCPQSRVTPLNLLRNCWHAHRHRGTINHITGDVHYLALALPRKSTILTIHDCVLLTRYPVWHPIHWFHYYVWYKWPTNRAGTITTISEKSKAELVRLVGVEPSKVQVIPNFYDPALLSDVEIRLVKQQPTILQVGTGPNKNLERLIEALTGLPCCLLIIGQPTATQQELLRTHQITYRAMANIDGVALHQAYIEADLVSFASLYEGFGLPILEAQAMSRPVVTSNLEPMCTIAGNGASLVDPMDPTAIRSAIEQILTDATHREKLITDGRANVNRYSIEQVAAQYMTLYNSLHAN